MNIWNGNGLLLCVLDRQPTQRHAKCKGNVFLRYRVILGIRKLRGQLRLDLAYLAFVTGAGLLAAIQAHIKSLIRVLRYHWLASD